MCEEERRRTEDDVAGVMFKLSGPPRVSSGDEG